VWDDLFLAIHWDRLLYGFDITVQHGDAGIFTLPPPGASFPAIGAAIGSSQIRGFTLKPEPESGLIEVVLEVTYNPNEESLGLTDQLEEAKRWVADANELVRRVRERKQQSSS
jgi:hypothetical protein